VTAVLIAFNVIAGLFLVGVVLLQAGKGADMGAAFGGANPAAFGPAAQGNVLQKITAATAAVFMGTSLALAIVSSRQESVIEGMAEPPPVAQPVAPVAIPGGVDMPGVDIAVPSVQPEAAIDAPAREPTDGTGQAAADTGADSPPPGAAQAEAASDEPSTNEAAPADEAPARDAAPAE
jgi:preprotein translocase subunit SecG